MMKRLSGWVKTHSMVGDVRGRGLMIGVEIVKDKKTKAIAHDERDRIVELAFERGLLFLGAGENSVRIAPPLVVTQEQADIAMDVLEECIGIVEKENSRFVTSRSEAREPYRKRMPVGQTMSYRHFLLTYYILAQVRIFGTIGIPRRSSGFQKKICSR